MENKTKEEIGQGTAMTKEDFAALWKTIRLKVTDTYEVPPEILWVNGSTIGTLGNFSASTGKAKSKKTFNISAIVAAALKNDEVLKYSAYLPPNKRKILYVDTEQSKYHCHKVMERILRLAGLPTDKDVDDFVFIVLREQTPDKRKQIIGYMLENMPDVGLLIIDGIRDLMYDINSPSESTDLINLLMRWSSGYNLHIHTVLHLNSKYSINSLVYWVTYVHNVVYSFYRSMIYCYINSTQRCAGSIVIDIIPTNGADKRKFFPFAPYFPVTNVIKRYFYPYFPAIIGIKGYSFPYFPYLSGIMKIKTALYSLFSRLDWHKTVVFPCLGEIYEGIRSLSWEIPVT